MSKRFNTVIIGLVSFIILVLTSRLMVKHIDFFVNQKQGYGKITKEEIIKNKIYLSIVYYNTNTQRNESVDKVYSINYKDRIEKMHNENIDVLYSKWFRQLYIKGVSEPRLVILLLELALVIFFLYAVFSFFRSVFLSGVSA